MCLRAGEPAVDRADVALGGALADLGGEQLPDRRAHQRLGREQVDALVAAPLLVARDRGEHLALHLRAGRRRRRAAPGRRRASRRRGCRAGRWRSFEAPVDQVSRARASSPGRARRSCVTSFGAAAARIASCWRTDARPASEPKRSRSRRRSRGIRRSSVARQLGVGGGGQQHGVEGVVGGERGVDVDGLERLAAKWALALLIASRSARGEPRHAELGAPARGSRRRSGTHRAPPAGPAARPA